MTSWTSPASVAANRSASRPPVRIVVASTAAYTGSWTASEIQRSPSVVCVIVVTSESSADGARRTPVGERHLEHLPVGRAEQVRLDADLARGVVEAVGPQPGQDRGVRVRSPRLVRHPRLQQLELAGHDGCRVVDGHGGSLADPRARLSGGAAPAGAPRGAARIAAAALTRARCDSACGKLPSISPVAGSICSASRPTSLISAHRLVHQRARLVQLAQRGQRRDQPEGAGEEAPSSPSMPV